MKIGFTKLNIPEGKIKYKDKILAALANKDKPKKISPFFVEFLKDEYLNIDAIAIHENHLLDILILDMDKIEGRLNRAVDKNETDLLNKCLLHLEKEEPLCTLQFNDSENRLVSGSQDNNAIVWEFDDTGIINKSLPMLHENEVAFCTFIPGDEFNVLTINQSGKVRIWDYSLPAVILGPYSPGYEDRTSMFPEGSFIDNNDRFLSFNGQNKLRVWNIPSMGQDTAYKSDDLLNISELMLGWRNELKEKISADDHEKSVNSLLKREGESAIKNYINWYYNKSDQTRVTSPYS